MAGTEGATIQEHTLELVVAAELIAPHPALES